VEKVLLAKDHTRAKHHGPRGTHPSSTLKKAMKTTRSCLRQKVHCHLSLSLRARPIRNKALGRFSVTKGAQDLNGEIPELLVFQ
jgi:hypothetical protein